MDNLNLSEAETRALIDEQLRTVGWKADTVTLRYNKGTRPTKGRNLAVAKWQTATGPADCHLFPCIKKGTALARFGAGGLNINDLWQAYIRGGEIGWTWLGGTGHLPANPYNDKVFLLIIKVYFSIYWMVEYSQDIGRV